MLQASARMRVTRFIVILAPLGAVLGRGFSPASAPPTRGIKAARVPCAHASSLRAARRHETRDLHLLVLLLLLVENPWIVTWVVVGAEPGEGSGDDSGRQEVGA